MSSFGKARVREWRSIRMVLSQMESTFIIYKETLISNSRIHGWDSIRRSCAASFSLGRIYRQNQSNPCGIPIWKTPTIVSETSGSIRSSDLNLSPARGLRFQDPARLSLVAGKSSQRYPGRRNVRRVVLVDSPRQLRF